MDSSASYTDLQKTIKKRFSPMLVAILIALMIANRFAFACSRSLAKGIAVNASVAMIIANQVTYSGCPVNLMLSDIEFENALAKTIKEALETNTEIKAVV